MSLDPRQSESVELAMMRENIATFKERIVKFLRSGDSWPCPRCAHPIEPPEDGWWNSQELREATGCWQPSGPMAISELVAAGVLEMDRRFRVRLVS